MNTVTHSWPNDADGDVLRRLESRGFDFSKIYPLDFNIDFDQWPPCEDAITAIRRAYPEAKVHGDENEGYILFKIKGRLTHNLVVQTQLEATELVASYGGKCESWGVLHK